MTHSLIKAFNGCLILLILLAVLLLFLYLFSPSHHIKMMESIENKGSSCAVTADKRLFCWGERFPSTYEKNIKECLLPKEILDDVASVTLSYHIRCAIKTNKALYCWGFNRYGQVGNGTTIDQQTPVEVMQDVSSVVSNGFHTCAIKTNGDLYCWGHNEKGHVGNGTTKDQVTPYKVLTDIASVNVDGSQTCAIKTDKKLFCWGGSATGGGYRNDPLILQPEEVLDDVEGLTSLGGYYFARKTDGTLYFRGRYSWGVHENGMIPFQHTPVEVLKDVTKVVNHDSYYAFNYIIKNDGALYGWGTNVYGLLGNGSEDEVISEPVKILEDVSSVALRPEHTCALKKDGQLFCWGHNYYGQVGNGNTEKQLLPVKVLDNVVRVSLKIGRTCAVTTDNRLFCWGRNRYGQVGNGSDDEIVPVPVEVLQDVSDVFLANGYTCAIKTSGDLYCWGFDSSVNNTIYVQRTPMKVLENVISWANDSSDPDLNYSVMKNLEKRNVSFYKYIFNLFF